MPGQFQLSVDQLARETEELTELGIGAVLLFGIPAEKDARRRRAPTTRRESSRRRSGRSSGHAPDLLVITDVCGCEYTDHGHCGILDGCEVDNDLTLAAAGADRASATPRPAPTSSPRRT